MRSTRFIVRTRARAKLVAAVVAISSLVGIGAVTAAPAFAITIGTASITFTDFSASGAPYAGAPFDVASAGTFVQSVTSDGSGVVSLALPYGDYTITPTAPEYSQVAYPFTIDTPSDTVETFSVGRDGTLTGTVPTGMGSGATTAEIQLYDGLSWNRVSTETVSALDDSFEWTLTEGDGLYRVLFHPSQASPYLATFSPTLARGSEGSIVDLGLVPFTAAAIVSGTVLDLYSGVPIVGAAVSVELAADVVTGATDADGSYRIKLPQVDGDYTVFADAVDYERRYWDASTTLADATGVTLDAASGFVATAIDLGLPRTRPDLTVNTVALDGSGALPVSYYLYAKGVGGSYSPVPYLGPLDAPGTTFGELPAGDYRLAFAASDCSRWLPWTSLDVVGSTATAPPSPADCFVLFTVTAGQANYVFSDITLDTSVDEYYCEKPPWTSPGEAVVSGTVLNASAMTGPIRASLWAASGDVLIDTSPVNMTTGAYSLDGLGVDGDYFLEFEPAALDPFLDTYLGSDAGTPITIWVDDRDALRDISTHFALPLLAGVASIGNDVTLAAATVIVGQVASGGDPIAGACVYVSSVSASDAYYCATAAADGRYVVKVPPGQSWRLAASALGYDPQFWQNHADSADADPIGPTVAGILTHYDFTLVADPALLGGILFESSTGMVDDYIVHLYATVPGGYKELGTTTTAPVGGIFNFLFDPALVADPSASYRLRFESPTHDWVMVGEYYVTDMATAFAPGFTEPPTAGPNCFIDLATIKPGPVTIALALYFAADQLPGACTAQSVVVSTTSGSSGSSVQSFTGSGAVEPATTPEPTASTVTDDQAQNEQAPVDSSVGEDPLESSPVSSGGVAGWLIVLLSVLGVLGVGTAGFALMRRR